MLDLSTRIINQRSKRDHTILRRSGSYNAGSPGIGVELRDHRDGDDMTPAKMIDRKHSYDDTLIAKRFEQESQIDTICLTIDHPNRYLGTPSWYTYKQTITDELTHFWSHHGHHVNFLHCSMQGISSDDCSQNDRPSWISRFAKVWTYQFLGSQKTLHTHLDSIINTYPYAFYCIRGDARLAPYFQTKLHNHQYIHLFINPAYYGGLIGSPLPSSSFSSSDHPLDWQTVT
ncbi:MAG: hypothetical protein NZL83_03970 [Candidatus Absconditabacterales bacterium]|nr:hypothetical protein [Candidatus Absconditabacterales bacterium]